MKIKNDILEYCPQHEHREQAEAVAKESDVEKVQRCLCRKCFRIMFLHASALMPERHMLRRFFKL